MAKNKESFFWTSYSDLMTSLFFIMLTLFVLVIVLLHKRMEATEMQLEEIKRAEKSTKELNRNYFEYIPDYKKYRLAITVAYPSGEYDINNMIVDNVVKVKNDLMSAGKEISKFLENNNDNKYILIIEGQASNDGYAFNYELSYQRALGLIKFWNQKGIKFNNNCEILIAGSGDGTIPTHSMREVGSEVKNQRFLIHILPKINVEEQ